MSEHGTRTRYVYNKCRCDLCTEANRRDCERAKAERASRRTPEHVHGLNGYRNYACRCAVCTAANSVACSEYFQRRKARAAS